MGELNFISYENNRLHFSIGKNTASSPKFSVRAYGDTIGPLMEGLGYAFKLTISGDPDKVFYVNKRSMAKQILLQSPQEKDLAHFNIAKDAVINALFLKHLPQNLETLQTRRAMWLQSTEAHKAIRKIESELQKAQPHINLGVLAQPERERGLTQLEPQKTIADRYGEPFTQLAFNDTQRNIRATTIQLANKKVWDYSHDDPTQSLEERHRERAFAVVDTLRDQVLLSRPNMIDKKATEAVHIALEAATQTYAAPYLTVIMNQSLPKGYIVSDTKLKTVNYRVEDGYIYVTQELAFKVQKADELQVDLCVYTGVTSRLKINIETGEMTEAQNPTWGVPENLWPKLDARDYAKRVLSEAYSSLPCNPINPKTRPVSPASQDDVIKLKLKWPDDKPREAAIQALSPSYDEPYSKLLADKLKSAGINISGLDAKKQLDVEQGVGYIDLKVTSSYNLPPPAVDQATFTRTTRIRDDGTIVARPVIWGTEGA